MERRLAITYAVSATATLCTACIAIATVGGGLFAQAAPARSGGVKQVETVDNYIVVHSSTTEPARSDWLLSSALVAAPATTAEPEPETTAARAVASAPVKTHAPAPTDPPATPAPSMESAPSEPKPQSSPDETHPKADDESDDWHGATVPHYGDDDHEDEGHEGDEHEGDG